MATKKAKTPIGTVAQMFPDEVFVCLVYADDDRSPTPVYGESAEDAVRTAKDIGVLVVNDQGRVVIGRYDWFSAQVSPIDVDDDAHLYRNQ